MQLLFTEELKTRNINTSFTLNPSIKNNLYLTKKVNTNFRKPYQSDFVYAGFESPNIFFFREMKWIIITSLLLISITAGCFVYTVKTLLSQNKLSELKDSFVNNMTHELNTPIASIKITVEALRTFKHSLNTQHEYLNIIGHQADKLGELTDQILTGRKGTIKFNKEKIEMIELVANVIDTLQPQINKHRSNIDYRFDKSKVYVSGDRNSLQNVIINLIDNSLKYSVNQPEIKIEVNSESKYVCIIVSDHGIGIPGEYKQAIFEPFFRVPQGNLHNVKGFGLGLSYVNEVIKLHKGSIAVIDNISTGTTFTIKLPLC